MYHNKTGVEIRQTGVEIRRMTGVAWRELCLRFTEWTFVNRYHNQTGVEIRPYDWGGLEGVAALDPDAPSYSGTYSELLKGLQAKGYTAKKDLFGAPFDFRLNAEALQQVTHCNASPSHGSQTCS